MTRSNFAASALAVLSLASVGCGLKTPAVAFTEDGEYLQQDVGAGLVASPNPLIPDVPMPVGFKAVASQSSWRYDGNVRVVHHVYQGHAKQGDAVEFYRTLLPDAHWTLVDMQSVGESTIQHYAKGPERLAVSTKHTWGVTTVTIDITGR